MGMAGGGDSGTSHQISEVKLPAWVEAASQSNYKFAEQIANAPFQQYKGQEVAKLNDIQKSLPGLLELFSGGQGANYDQANAAYSSLLGYNPTQATASTYNPTLLRDQNLAAYMNPYTDEVERRAISNAARQGEIAQQGIASDAVKKGAFGGSRQAIQAAVQGAETTRGIGDLSADLRSKNFSQAQAAASGDVTSMNQAAQFNAAAIQQVGLQNIQNELAAKGIQKGAADALIASASQGDEAAMQKLVATTSVGQMFYDQEQKRLDVRTRRANERINAPLEKLNILLSSLGMSPYGKTETTTKKEEKQSGMDIGSILASVIGAGAKIYGASDRTLKTDITHIGHDPKLDVPIYAYRYKGDSKKYPKVVGPMAQDIEKKHPHLVRKVGRKRVVDMTALVA